MKQKKQHTHRLLLLQLQHIIIIIYKWHGSLFTVPVSAASPALLLARVVRLPSEEEAVCALARASG